MRRSHVFVGSSHPELGRLICERLGTEPGPCTLRNFSNGETSVEIGVSVRDEDVYVVQSGSSTINDAIMELLILISGCRGGSAHKITAVLPLFPYSKQSKMKKHRGAITARMLANLLAMAGADHVITMDLHASQMQGFFSKPVDNLYAGPTLARWIKHNVPDYQNAVIVSKNPGGTKRVTALADALKVNFAMIHTDRRRHRDKAIPSTPRVTANPARDNLLSGLSESSLSDPFVDRKTEKVEMEYDEENGLVNAHGIQVARVVQGHVVDEDYISTEGGSDESDSSRADRGDTPVNEELQESVISNVETAHALGGSVDPDLSDDDEEESYHQEERLIALVGDVRDKTAIILDDMIDRPSSFIAAAEHCRLNCGAKSVYIVATHGIFSEGSLETLTASPCIDHIVVTNTYPIPKERVEKSSKLTVIDISSIFAECIRRNHYGESISALFEQLTTL